MNRGGKNFACVAFAILIVLAISFVTMSLWNWLVPSLFNGPVVTFWQALGLLILTKILLWGVGGKSHHLPTGSCKEEVYQKFSNMSSEDREAIKKKMKDKWCRWDENNPNASSDS